ncbi:MAG: hypothetical protein ACJ8FS_16435 [Sphingomicrobium sp.]
MIELRPGFVVFDEAADITPRQWRAAGRYARRQRAKGWGWFNWYVNRGRLSLDPSKSELRRVSWRRAH